MARMTQPVTLVLLILLATAVSAQAPLKVLCRMGQAPFNNADSINATVCNGMFSDIFYMAMNMTGLPYTVDIKNVNSVDSFVRLNAAGVSQYDMAITYQTQTTPRLALYDFSIPMEQSADCIALRPSFKKQGGSLVKSVIRDSVMYLFLIWVTFALGMGVVILVAEWMSEESSIHEYPMWVRPLFAVEMGLEVVGTFGTSEDMDSQITKSMRSIVAIMGFFLVVLFSASVTSQLTSASLGNTDVTVKDIRGSQIAISSSTLTAYLSGMGIGAKPVIVTNLEQFAEDFYKGGNADYDGYTTACDVVYHIHKEYSGDAKGFVVSQPYFKGGANTYEVRAFPLSKAMNKTSAAAINRAMSQIRESGTLAKLIDQYVPPSPTASGASDDLPIDQDAWVAIRAAIGVTYGLLGLFVLIALAKHIIDVIAHKQKEEEDARGPSTIGSEKHELVWKHRKFKEIDPDSRAVIRAMLANKAPMMDDGAPDTEMTRK